MPFAKHGVAPIAVVKCGCGQTLNSAHVACPKCGKNLRPLSNASEKKTDDNATTEQLLDSAQQLSALDSTND